MKFCNAKIANYMPLYNLLLLSVAIVPSSAVRREKEEGGGRREEGGGRREGWGNRVEERKWRKWEGRGGSEG